MRVSRFSSVNLRLLDKAPAVDDNTAAISSTGWYVGQASSSTPVMDGTGTIGTSLRFARADHVHPTNTLLAPLASPTLTGTPAAPTAAADTNTTQLATTAFVIGQAGSATPIIDGTATVGTSLRYARQDHVHPTDTTRASLASPTLTGTPAAPTAAQDTNTTQLATTAFVIAQASAVAPLADTTGGAVGTSLRYARADHTHPGASGHFIGEILNWPSLTLPTYSSETYGWTDGSAVSRGTYSTLLGQITLAQNGTRTNTSKVITGLGQTAGLAIGMPVEGTGIPGSTTIQSVDSSSQITLSQNASSSGTNTVTVFPWGNGDGSTTFNVPDSRGRNWVGIALSGGHLDVSGMGNNEGVAATFRRMKHRHTVSGAPGVGSLSVSGAPGVGTLALPSHVHNFTGDSAVKYNGATIAAGMGGSPSADSTGFSLASQSVGVPTSLPAITGAPALGSLAVAGAPTAGTLATGVSTNDSLDSAPYAVIGYPIRML